MNITWLRELEQRAAKGGTHAVNEFEEAALSALPALLDELEAARKVVDAARKYLTDWDSQVADPNAACYQCDDPDHIAELRAALSAHAAAGKGDAAGGGQP